MTAASGKEAVANGRAVHTYSQGYCQQYVRLPCWEVGSLYGSAIEAWNGARHKHPGDRKPPVGAPCYYRGGSYGHAVISTGGGGIRSTDCTTATHVNDTDLGWPERAWGYTYLGWTEDLNGVDLPITEGSDDPLAKYDNDEELSSAVLHGHEWAKSGEDDPENLQQHVTDLRRQVAHINDTVNKILEKLK